MIHWKTLRVPLIGLVILSILPLFVQQTYILQLIVVMFIFIVLAAAFDFHRSQAGLFSLGNTAFYGIGAYTFAILAMGGWPFYVALLAGGAMAAVIAASLTPTFRLRGDFFAIATLVILRATYEVANNLEITGGPYGINIVQNSPGLIANYYGGLALATVMLATSYVLINSRIGLGLRAIGNDEEAAASLGIAVTFHKFIAWGVAAFFTGMGGALFTYMSLTYITPGTVLGEPLNWLVITMANFGGAGSLLGPILGSSSITIIQQFTTTYFTTLQPAIIGAILVIVVMFLQGGLVTFVRKITPHR